MKLTEQPELLSQFHPTKNDRQASQYTSGERKTKIWWQCPIAHDHVWPARFADRIQVYKRKGSFHYDDNGTVGCPFCAPNPKPSSTNNLAKFRPEIAQEWNYEKNNGIKPQDVTINSNKNVFWICPKGHSYDSSVHDRTRKDRPHSCPECSSKNSSPEFRIFAELKLFFPNIIHRQKIEHLEADIFIPELKLAIEYDGGYYHRSEPQDRKKNDFFSKKAIKLVRIRQGSLKKIEPQDIVVKSPKIEKPTVNMLLLTIREMFPNITFGKDIDEYCEQKTLQNDDLYYDLLANIKSSSEEDALITVFPGLLERWDYKRNGKLNPTAVSKGDSRLMLFFICPEHGEYQRTAYSISRLVDANASLGCSKCSGREASEIRNLANMYPKLASQFARDLNENLDPTKITPGSSRNVWWRCKSGHEFQRIVRHRTKKGEDDKCPRCKSHPRARN